MDHDQAPQHFNFNITGQKKRTSSSSRYRLASHHIMCMPGKKADVMVIKIVTRQMIGVPAFIHSRNFRLTWWTNLLTGPTHEVCSIHIVDYVTFHFFSGTHYNQLQKLNKLDYKILPRLIYHNRQTFSPVTFWTIYIFRINAAFKIKIMLKTSSRILSPLELRNLMLLARIKFFLDNGFEFKLIIFRI